MRRIFVTVGPQGAGKSVYCKKIIQEHSSVKLICRDEILFSLFGSSWIDPHTGGHFRAKEIMFERLSGLLIQEDADIIVDSYTGRSYERRELTSKLRELGAERVLALNFLTPADVCYQWFFEREGHPSTQNEAGEKERYLEYHRAYRSEPVNMEEGFDRIIRVNPIQGDLFFL